jgi:hypothetical protein
MLPCDTPGCARLSPLGLKATVLSAVNNARGAATATADDLDVAKGVLTELAGYCCRIVRLVRDPAGEEEILSTTIADATDRLERHRELLARVAQSVFPMTEPATCSNRLLSSSKSARRLP